MAIVTSSTPEPRRTSGTVAAYPIEYAAHKRIRWGAIFAGALIAIAISFALNLLGVGIGLSTINPTTEVDPFAGLGTGAIIWYVIANLLALFAGGYVAGRLAGFPRETTAGLHGVLAWALFTMVSLYILNSAVGRVFNVVGSTISTVASTAGNAVAAVLPDDLGQEIQQGLNNSDISLQSLRRDAFQLLEDTGKPELDPNNLEQRAENAASTAEQGAGQVASSPYAAGRELNEIIDRIASSGSEVVNAADKEALVNVIVARTDQTPAEARRTVDGWAQQYQQARAEVKQQVEQLGETAKEVGGDVADTLATVSILGFLALLAGAGAAFFGGTLGRSHDVTLLASENTVNAAAVD